MSKSENFFNGITTLLTSSGGTMNLKIMNFFWNVFQYDHRQYYLNHVTISK